MIRNNAWSFNSIFQKLKNGGYVTRVSGGFLSEIQFVTPEHMLLPPKKHLKLLKKII
jgi:hypothetical protein